jgi:hypothetical protein
MANKYSYLLANNEDINEWIDLDSMLADRDIPEDAILELSKHGIDSADEFGGLLLHLILSTATTIGAAFAIAVQYQKWKKEKSETSTNQSVIDNGK